MFLIFYNSQEDFPSTPSSLYSNRLLQEDVRFESDMQAAELKVVSITDDAAPSFLPQGASIARTGSAPGLPPGHMDEQLAKSLQQLYVDQVSI